MGSGKKQQRHGHPKDEIDCFVIPTSAPQIFDDARKNNGPREKTDQGNTNEIIPGLRAIEASGCIAAKMLRPQIIIQVSRVSRFGLKIPGENNSKKNASARN